MRERLARLPVTILLALVRGYQLFFSSFFGRSCRFYPTCSCYAQDSLRRHGALWGSALTFWRILRCGPFSRGGYDPVPENPPRLKGLGRSRKTGSDSRSACVKHHRS